jgi:serine/threonine-protein kinase
MADVYKVYDKQRRTYLAMKVMKADLAEDREFLRRFKRDAAHMTKLQHPNIVRFYGLEQEEGLAFMLLEFIDGRTLKTEIFNEKGPLALCKVLLVMRSICSALHYAHQSGYVHCDVKPANIMINNKGDVFLVDFGIAREVDATTSTMIGFGAPAYMAPEQIKGADPSASMDIYSLGVTLYEMLTGGRRPFTGDKAQNTGTASQKVRWEQLKLKPPSPKLYNSNISDALEAVVMKCLEKAPSRRFRNTMDLQDVLQAALPKIDPAVLTRCLVRKTGEDETKFNFMQWLQSMANRVPIPFVQRNPVVLAAASVLLLIGLILAIALPGGNEPPDETHMAEATNRDSEIPNEAGEYQPQEVAEVQVPPVPQPTYTPRFTETPPKCTRDGEIWTDPTDMADLVCVSEGDFIMGSRDDNMIALKKREEILYERIYLDAYWIDQMEVSVGQFQQFVNETGYQTGAERQHFGHTMNIIENTWSINPRSDWLHPQGSGEAEMDHPVTQVTWNDAMAYCEWAGRTLPTEAQWEKAARGTTGFNFPFETDRQYVYCLNANFSDDSLGAKYSKDGCDDGYKFTAPVYETYYCRSYLGACASVLDNPYNIYNILGNVTEWVLDDWNGKWYSKISSNNPVFISNSNQKSIRGGSWGAMPEKNRPTNRDYDQIDAAYDTLGFRCAYTP